MIKSIVNRMVSATRVLFTRRLLLIEAHRAPDGRDYITMWGTMTDKPEEIRVLRRLADSIERDHQVEQRKKLVNLDKQIN